MQGREMSFETALAEFLRHVLGFLDPGSRIHVFYLASALLLALVAHWQIERAHRLEAEAEGAPYRRRTSFLAYVFDRKVWLHPSSLQDMRYFVVNAFVYYALIAQVLVGTHHLSEAFHQALTAGFGTPEAPLLTGFLAVALYTLAAVLALDLAVWTAHYLFHRVPVLWHFHAVHHSAEQLNPFTLFRMHPVDLAVTATIVTLFQGAAFAGFFYLSGETPVASTLFGLNVVTFLFYVAGYNLRHSHIWLNYPVWLSRILISPAQHQIHHSSDPKHFDRNLGLVFSFWDQLFGTHYIPREREALTFGLSREEPNPYGSLAQLYAKPFAQAWATLRASRTGAPSPLRPVLIVALAAAVGFGGVSWNRSQAAAEAAAQAARRPPGLPSLMLERLTWTEIDHALASGFDTVIVPTGGTEQNGPFVALGKHNVVVAHTAERVARAVGRTLVAPVMAYVPEGRIEPPDGHMRFAGTLSLPEPVFEAVLEATARSLKVHGFRTILIMGDSGWSQAAQQRVAERLSRAWRATGVRVASMADYYGANGQTAWLRRQGFTPVEIGTHAGMRDMSELLALAPGDVRLEPRNLLPGRDPGANGDPERASTMIGRRMLDLKIETAVREIERLRAAPAG